MTKKQVGGRTVARKVPNPPRQAVYVMMRLRDGKAEYVELTRKPDYARASGETLA